MIALQFLHTLLMIERDRPIVGAARVAHVVDNHIKNYPHATLMGLLYKFTQLWLRTKPRVDVSKINRTITMIRAVVTINGSEHQCADTEVTQIIQPINDAAQVTTISWIQIRIRIHHFRGVHGQTIVGRIAIIKAINLNFVDDFVAPKNR